MQVIAWIGLCGCVGLLIVFILYARTTQKLLRDQEKEIARLTTQLKREMQKEPLYIIQDGRNPKFGEF